MSTPRDHLFCSVLFLVQRKQGEPLRAFLDIEATRKRSGNEDIFIGYHASDDVQVTYAGKFFQITHNYHVATKKRDVSQTKFSSSLHSNVNA